MNRVVLTIGSYLLSQTILSCAGGPTPSSTPSSAQATPVGTGGTPSQRGATPVTLPIVEGDGYKGVIFPPDWLDQGTRSRNRWLPSSVDVAEFERMLPQALTSALLDPSLLNHSAPSKARSDLEEIIPILRSYTRQYAGAVVDGRRILVGRFFEGPELFPDWRQRWVSVRGGGTGFWHIQFDVEAKRFSEFNVNADR
jgi:hypothetical protein